jgi:hypothetical protein
VISGTVIDLQARVGVVFRLPGHSDVAIEFVVDTGFEGALTLPPVAVRAMGLPYFHEDTETVDTQANGNGTTSLDAADGSTQATGDFNSDGNDDIQFSDGTSADVNVDTGDSIDSGDDD